MMLEIKRKQTWINTSRIWKVTVRGAAGIEFVVIDYGRNRERLAWFGIETEEARAILRWLQNEQEITAGDGKDTTKGGQYDRRKNHN